MSIGPRGAPSPSFITSSSSAMPHVLIPLPALAAKAAARHRRTQGRDMIPLVLQPQASLPIRTAAGSIDSIEKQWTFDDASDEDVPLPTMRESAVRQARARAFTEMRLKSLQYDASMPERSEPISPEQNIVSISTPIASVLHNTIEGFATDELGVICPSSWRTINHGNSLLDRRWLHEVNPLTFDEHGMLMEPLLYVKDQSASHCYIGSG